MKTNRFVQLIFVGLVIVATAVPTSASVPVLSGDEREVIVRPRGLNDLARRLSDGTLVLITGGRNGPEGQWQVETLAYDQWGKRVVRFSSVDELRLVEGRSNLGRYVLPPNFTVGYGWSGFADSYYPLYLVQPLRHVYLRVAGLLGEPKYLTVIERNKLGNGEVGEFNFGADWGTIWINEGLFLPNLGDFDRNAGYLDELTHEFGHQRLVGWDGNTHQGFAEALAWATRGEMEPFWYGIYRDYLEGEVPDWMLVGGRKEMIVAAGAFYEIQQKYPGFLPYWSRKTDELRARSRDEYRTPPALTEDLARQWAEGFRPGLWKEIQLLISELD